MPSIQLFHWSLWGLSLLAGVGAILALYKLDFLSDTSRLKEEPIGTESARCRSVAKKNAAVARPSKCRDRSRHNLNPTSVICGF